METADALSSTDRADAERKIWQTFAVFGMGPDARSYGSTVYGIVADHSVPGGPSIDGEVVAIVPTGTAGGYWLVTVGGRVYAFGDATDYGSVEATEANPVVAVERVPAGDGYWVVQADGTVHSFGDATDLSVDDLSDSESAG